MNHEKINILATYWLEKYFEANPSRANNWILKPNPPEFIKQLCKEAEKGRVDNYALPKDGWRISFVAEILREQHLGPYCPTGDVEPDNLSAWLASTPQRYFYCERAYRALSPERKKKHLHLYDWLRKGQEVEKQAVYKIVIPYLTHYLETVFTGRPQTINKLLNTL